MNPNGKPYPLSAVKAGETRLRTKGGASQESLFALINGYVDASRAPRSRPGTGIDRVLPTGSKGLTFFKGQRWVFAHDVIPGLSAGRYRLGILRHPTDPTRAIKRISFAKPMMQALYVVAVFEDDSVYHYWLQDPAMWQANTVYAIGAMVKPSADNGFLYTAERATTPGLAWAPQVARTVGDVIEPTTYNGFEYVAIDTFGDNPRSGNVEPTWPTVEGATVNEDVDGTGGDAVPPSQPDPGTTLPPATNDRYHRSNDSRSIQ